MAIFNVTGLDEAIKQLDLAADALKERARKRQSRAERSQRQHSSEARPCARDSLPPR